MSGGVHARSFNPTRNASHRFVLFHSTRDLCDSSRLRAGARLGCNRSRLILLSSLSSRSWQPGSTGKKDFDQRPLRWRGAARYALVCFTAIPGHFFCFYQRSANCPSAARISYRHLYVLDNSRYLCVSLCPCVGECFERSKLYLSTSVDAGRLKSAGVHRSYPTTTCA